MQNLKCSFGDVWVKKSVYLLTTQPKVKISVLEGINIFGKDSKPTQKWKTLEQHNSNIVFYNGLINKLIVQKE